MVDDKYNLVCKGEIIKGFDKGKVLIQLANIFNSTEEKVSKIFNPGKKNIVNNLSWGVAIKYKNKLKSIGLIVYIDVSLNSNIFHDSLFPRHKQKYNIGSKNDEALKTNQLETKMEVDDSRYLLKFVSKKLIPAMVYPPHSEMVTDENGTPIFMLRSYNYSINKIFILLVSLLFALLIQKYFSLLLVIFYSNIIVIIISISIFILVIIFLPKVMTPCRIFSLQEEESGHPCILVVQRRSYNLFVGYYDLYSGNNKLIATVRHNKLKSLHECFDVSGGLILSCSEEHNVDNITKSVTEEIRDELFELNYLKYIKAITGIFNKIDKWFNKNPLIYKRESGFVVRDRNSRTIAVFYRDKVNAIELVEDIPDSELKFIVTAFSLMCVGID